MSSAMKTFGGTGKATKDREAESLDVLVRRGIRDGRYVPGQRLVEIDLMQRFGASQRKVRDTLRRLEAEGLVAIEKNRGAMVRRISKWEVACILDVLDSLSLLAVHKVSERMHDSKCRALIEESLVETKQFRENAANERKVQKYLDENVRFWDSIALLVDNPILWEIRERLETLLFRLQVQGLAVTSGPEMWITQHEGILLAILDQDVKLAEELVLHASAKVREAILGLDDEVFT